MTGREVDLEGLHRVYGRRGSRLFYSLVAQNARHWGWTEPGQSRWRLWRAQRQLQDVLGGKLALPAGAHVLDAGCGSGVVARAMASRFGLHVTGVDILDVNVRHARRLSTRAGMAERTTFSVGDYHGLDFPDASFDGIYAMETLVHSHNPPQALAEFYRLLRPGGRLVILGPVSIPLRKMSAHDRALCEPYLDDMVLPGLYHTGDLEHLLPAAGFDVAEALDTTEWYLPTSRALHSLFRGPYAVLRAFGAVDKWLNIRSVVETYQARKSISFFIHTAVKPL